jgi:hypothetical protein
MQTNMQTNKNTQKQRKNKNKNKNGPSTSATIHDDQLSLKLTLFANHYPHHQLRGEGICFSFFLCSQHVPFSFPSDSQYVP